MTRLRWSQVSMHVLGALTLGLLFSTASAKTPIKIGVSLGLTGAYSAPAQMQRRAYALWSSEINASGGLLGRPVELIVKDDGGNAVHAAHIYESLISEAKVDLIFGPYSSPITGAVATVAEQHDFPLLAAGASADQLWQQGYRNLFGMWVPATQYTHGMLRLAVARNYQRIAIMHADDSFSDAIRAGTQRWSQYLPVTIVASIPFKKGNKELAEQVANAMEQSPQLIIVAGHFDDAVNVRNALARWIEGVNYRSAPAFYATVGPALVSWNEKMGALAEGAYSTSIWEPSVQFSNAALFARTFEKRYEIEPSYHAATAYAAGQLLATAIRRANSIDRRVLREVLADLDTDTIIGRFGVDRTGMQVKSVPLIVQWQAGRKRIVWPATQRSGSRQ